MKSTITVHDKTIGCDLTPEPIGIFFISKYMIKKYGVEEAFKRKLQSKKRSVKFLLK